MFPTTRTGAPSPPLPCSRTTQFGGRARVGSADGVLAVPEPDLEPGSATHPVAAMQANTVMSMAITRTGECYPGGIETGPAATAPNEETGAVVGSVTERRG